MKKSILLISSVLFIIITSNLHAQLLRAGVGGGYTTITSDAFFDNGYQYGGKVVVGIPVLPLNAALNLYNNPLSTEVEGITIESSFFSAGLGGEFVILPGPLKPYVGLELLYVSTQESTWAGGSGGDPQTYFGLGLGAGAYFTLIPLIDLDLSAHYNMNSLISGDDDFTTAEIRLNILFNIL